MFNVCTTIHVHLRAYRSIAADGEQIKHTALVNVQLLYNATHLWEIVGDIFKSLFGYS